MKRLLQVRGPSGESGFTLLEILVGLTISSLIMVSLSLALTGINKGYDTTTAVIERQSTIATGLHVAAGDIARIERAVDKIEAPARFLFSGRPGDMIFVLAERPGNNQDGLYWVRYQVRDAERGQELIRMRAPFNQAETDMTAIAWSDEVALVQGNLAIGFAYRAPQSGIRAWGGTWAAPNMLPEQIKIELTDIATGRLRVPVLVVPLKVAAEAACAAPDAAGCTTQNSGVLTAAETAR